VLPKVLERWKASIATGEPFDMEFPLRGADGIFRSFLTRVLPLKDSAGSVIRWFGTNTDISALKRAEEALRAAHTELERRAFELEAVNRELEAFSYTVSHDLKAPLRSIEGFTKAILEDYAERLDETGRDYLTRAHSASQRMSHLIEAMLNMARLTRGAIQERTVDLSALAQVTAHEIRKQAPGRQVEFIIQKNVKAKGDQDMLQVMLENLLDNAWKFTNQQATEKIEFGTTNMDGKTVYFVRDDGAGFDMAFSDKLFKPFKRLHTESEFPGIGIGLAIAHRIIMRHNGRLWAESAPEKGATFFFTLA
jgi:light-regulated signal transduction histidine kinase (bacteriophytochrome)